MKEINNRRSIRAFKDKEIEDEKIHALLVAGMQAPSAGNSQAWEFIVVKDKEMLQALSETAPTAKPAKECAAAIIVVSNPGESEKARIMCQQDLSAATQNILLEAVHLGLGSVWLGVMPIPERMEHVSKVFHLPEEVKPFSIIALGYTDVQKNKFVDRYNKEKVHYEIW